MPNRVYCTYFDHNYLSRGLALYHSLQKHVPGARLWVLCLNEPCYRALSALNLPNLRLCRLADFEAADPEVAATRSTRSTIEYYFTCSPGWMLYVLNKEPSADWVTYLDGDLFFYSSPEAIYDELGDATVAIVPHRYTPKLVRLHKYGTYNVGWVGVRNDREGRSVIEWWRQRCVEWCHDYVEGDRFADQKYLDAFPGLSPRVKVIQHVGANLAPWNIGNYSVQFIDHQVMVNDRPLIFFHFQGLRRGYGFFVFNSHRRFRAPFGSEVRQHIYKPYVDQLLAIERDLGPIFDVPEARPHQRSGTSVDLKQYFANKGRALGTQAFQLMDIVTGRALIVIKGIAR
jgi:hypothetical protein